MIVSLCPVVTLSALGELRVQAPARVNTRAEWGEAEGVSTSVSTEAASTQRASTSVRPHPDQPSLPSLASIQLTLQNCTVSNISPELSND